MSPKKKPAKPKISYRDLMAGKTEPALQPAPQPEHPTPPPPPAAPEPVVAEPENRVVVVPPGDAPQSTTVVVPPPKELPPARRRDRSRELTPRELAAVLNSDQIEAERKKAEIAAAEARAAEEEAEKARQAAQAQVPGAALPALAQSLNASIIEDVGPRRSSGIGTDTMEFAVAAATSTLPFRDRVRSRAGIVEVLRFRIGTEFFATDLAAAEEALERPAVHRVPGMPDQMLGVFSLRGKLIPVFAPTKVLGAALAGEFGAAVVLRGDDRRVALAIDDVEDVMNIDLAKLRDIPASSDPEGVLLGVAWHGTELVSLIDADAVLAACQAEQLAETV